MWGREGKGKGQCMGSVCVVWGGGGRGEDFNNSEKISHSFSIICR